MSGLPAGILVLATLLCGAGELHADPELGTQTPAGGGEAMRMETSGPLHATEASTGPWWKQQKIRYVWGQARHYPAAEMREFIRNLARVGATVFVTDKTRADEVGFGGFDLEEARVAHDYGVRYFGNIYGSYLRERAANMGAPLAVRADGEPYFGYGRYTTIPLPCPVYVPLYEQHILEPALEAAASGVVDGVNLDWEPYERPEVRGVCYCEYCFGEFVAEHGLEVAPAEIEPAARHPWLAERDLAEAYTQSHQRRRLALWEGIRDRVQEVKADFIFAGYHVEDWTMRAGLHSPNAPLFVVDMRHYFEDQTRPWWQSYHAHEHALGYIRIAGSYHITFFGYQPETEVSLSQWLYDAAINADGVWLWWEEQWGLEMWHSFWSAHHRIQATERKVGDFLLHGRQDPHFVTPIEWSGDPSWQEKILHRTYHLGDEHLVHVHNVDTARPAQVRIRFPHLPAAGRWVVEDPISGLVYVGEWDTAAWSAAELDSGIIVSIENRSEQFLRLAPARAEAAPPPSGRISGRLVPPMPMHPPTTEVAAAPAPPAEPGQLVYTRTEDLGYAGTRGVGWSPGNALWTVGEGGEGNRRLRQLKGYLWSPVWSPDGSRLAFCHDTEGRGQIYVMQADGSEVVNVSDNSYCDRDAVWSPDGERLAFVSDRGGNWDICVMNADGTDQRQLTREAGCNHQPAWSPDGAQLAFASNRAGDFDIWLTDLTGSAQRALRSLPGDQREPAWSPDGTRIAFVDLGWVYPHLAIVTLATGRYDPYIVSAATYVGSPRWSPDGTRVAGVYRRNAWHDEEPGRISGVFSVSPEGSAHMGNEPQEHTVVWGRTSAPHHGGRRDPAYIPTWYAYGSASPRWVTGAFSGLCWSPDGEQLAFSANLDDDGYFHVYTVPAEGGEARKLPDTASAWPQAVDWSRR